MVRRQWEMRPVLLCRPERDERERLRLEIVAEVRPGLVGKVHTTAGDGRVLNLCLVTTVTLGVGEGGRDQSNSS